MPVDHRSTVTDRLQYGRGSQSGLPDPVSWPKRVIRERLESSSDETCGQGRRMHQGANRLLPVAAQHGTGMPQFDPLQSLASYTDNVLY